MNLMSVGLFVLTTAFQLVPSTSIFVLDMLGCDAFIYAGPFYIVGLLATGVLKPFIYIAFHPDIRSTAVRIAKCRWLFEKDEESDWTELRQQPSIAAVRRATSAAQNHRHCDAQKRQHHFFRTLSTPNRLFFVPLIQ